MTQQVVAVSATSRYAPVIGIAPFLLAHIVRIGRVGYWSIENGIAVGASPRATILELSSAGIVSLSRDLLALLGTSSH